MVTNGDIQMEPDGRILIKPETKTQKKYGARDEFPGTLVQEMLLQFMENNGRKY